MSVGFVKRFSVAYLLFYTPRQDADPADVRHGIPAQLKARLQFSNAGLASSLFFVQCIFA